MNTLNRSHLYNNNKTAFSKIEFLISSLKNQKMQKTNFTVLNVPFLIHKFLFEKVSGRQIFLRVFLRLKDLINSFVFVL
jgi:hypothetical protein